MKTLFDAARTALANAYAPYTGFKAGVALRLADGQIFAGCNVENVAFYGLDSLENAATVMLANSNWAPTGAPPRIEELFYCFDKIPFAHEGNPLPPAASLAIPGAFGHAGTRLAFADATGEIFEDGTCGSILGALPVPGYDADAFARAAKTRYEAAQPPPGIFNTDALRKLFHVRLMAFNPVSHYSVGAMVETASGQNFYGCNAEPGGNKGLHAEASAIAAMVTAGGPDQLIRRVTLITGGDEPGFPCGGCRQHINEFATPETEIVTMTAAGKTLKALQKDLLPHSFNRGTF